jgi:hypothetical protein
MCKTKEAFIAQLAPKWISSWDENWIKAICLRTNNGHCDCPNQKGNDQPRHFWNKFDFIPKWVNEVVPNSLTLTI